jgi:hypothetical protein
MKSTKKKIEEVQVTMEIRLAVPVVFTVRLDPDENEITHVQGVPYDYVSSVRMVSEAMDDRDLEELDRLVAKAVKAAKD